MYDRPGFLWSLRTELDDFARRLETDAAWQIEERPGSAELRFREMAREVLKDRYRYEIGLHYGYTSAVTHGSLMFLLNRLEGSRETYPYPGSVLEYFLCVSTCLQFVATLAPFYGCGRTMGGAELTAQAAAKALQREIPGLDKASGCQMFPGIVAFPDRDAFRRDATASNQSGTLGWAFRDGEQPEESTPE